MAITNNILFFLQSFGNYQISPGRWRSCAARFNYKPCLFSVMTGCLHFFLLSWFVTIAPPWASKTPIKVKPYCLRLSPSWSYFSSAACFQHGPESVCWFARVCARRAPNNACFTVGLCLPEEESSHITLVQILFFLLLKKTLILKFTLLTILASNCYLSIKQEAGFWD